MAQHDYVIADGSGLSVLADLNNALAAIASGNSGNAAPSVTYPYMIWNDTLNGLVKVRNASDTAWITVGVLGATNLGLAALSGATFTGPVTMPAGTFTDAVTVPSLNGGPLAGFRNRIINGNFDIWQNGTTFTGNEYGADQWFHGRVGSTHTVSRQVFTPGQTAVPGEPEFYCRTVVAAVAGAGNYSIQQQRIEDVRAFAGQQTTWRFWAKATTTKTIAVEFVQHFGTGGSPSADVLGIGVAKFSIGTSWQSIPVTVTLPSISGKTLGTDGNDYLGFTIWFDAGSNFNARTANLGQQNGTFDISQVQGEPGPIATPFEQRPVRVELALCQRYRHNGNIYGWGYAGSAGAVRIGVSYFPVEMRATPTITFPSATGNNATGQTVENATSKMFGVATSAIAAGSVSFNATYTASAQL